MQGWIHNGNSPFYCLNDGHWVRIIVHHCPSGGTGGGKKGRAGAGVAVSRWQKRYLCLPPLPVQDGSLQEKDLLGGQTSITSVEKRKKKTDKRLKSQKSPIVSYTVRRDSSPISVQAS